MRFNIFSICIGVLLLSQFCISNIIDDSEEFQEIITNELEESPKSEDNPLKKSEPHLDFSEDEFVGYEPQAYPKSTTNKPKVENILETKLNIQDPPATQNYYLEIAYIFFIVLFIFNYFIGKRSNEQIATALTSAISKPLRNNFSKVGEGKNVGVVKESQYKYILKAAGRIHTIGLQATLELRKRHDLFGLLMEIFWPQEDILTIDVLMEDNSMDTFVFAIMRKKEEKKYRKVAEDLNSFTGAGITVNGLSNTFCVSAECEELISYFLTSEVVASINKFEPFLKRIHFTDQELVSSTHKKSLQFVFKVPTKESEMEGIVVFTRMVFYFIDLVSRVKLSKQGKQKAINHRSKAAEKNSKMSHEQRQEAAQQRKIEKMQKEKEKIAAMSPETAAKFEEKLKKKEMRRNAPKMKVTIN